MGPLGSGPRLLSQIGSAVWVSVSFKQKIPTGFCPTMSYCSRKQGYDQGSCVRGEGGGWHITSSPSQTLRRSLVRTMDAVVCSTLAAIRRGFIFHTLRLVGLTTL